MAIERKTFFEAISLADMEKVHSAVIGWMLSDDCDAFDIKTKSEILKRLFNVDNSGCFQKIKAVVETHNIDILILTESNNGEKTCWVIENKIKSSQGCNQLNKYEKTIKEDYKNYTYKFCLLSLIKEKPISKQNWEYNDYNCLASLLESALKKSDKKKIDYSFLYEYLQSIKHMTSVLRSFIENHNNYKNVFTDGSKKKKDKSENNTYISKNNLETIFQKCLLGLILNKMKIPKEDLKEMVIAETRGVALIDNLSKTDINNQYESHIQIQDGTFKVFLGIKNGRKEQKEKFLDTWKSKIKTIADKKNMSVNPPKSYPSISISYPNKVWFEKI